MISMMLLPGACVVTFGHMLHDKRKEKKAEKVQPECFQTMEKAENNRKRNDNL